jgi:hypothetical protein
MPRGRRTLLARNAPRVETDNDVTLVEAKRQETTTMFDRINRSDAAITVAPLVGAAGATMAITAAVERWGQPRMPVAVAGSLVALTMSQSAEGATKQALAGAAAAGACIALGEFLQMLRPKLVFGDKPREQPAPPPTPPDAISREDLRKALAELQAQLMAQAQERAEAQHNQLVELQGMVRTLVAQLRAAHAEIDRLNDEARRRRARNNNPQPRMHLVPVEQPPPAPVESLDEATSPDPTTVAEPAAPTNIEVSSEELDAMQAVYSLLDDDERKQLSSIVANLPIEDAERLRAHFAGIDPHDAAAYLRPFLATQRTAS